MEYLPEQDGSLQITQTEAGLQLTVTGHGLAEGRAADALILTSPDKIMNWELHNCAKAWVSYVNNDSMLWCYGGYYRESPYNYIPTGTNLLLLRRMLLHPKLSVPHAAVSGSARARHSDA